MQQEELKDLSAHSRGQHARVERGGNTSIGRSPTLSLPISIPDLMAIPDRIAVAKRVLSRPRGMDLVMIGLAAADARALVAVVGQVVEVPIEGVGLVLALGQGLLGEAEARVDAVAAAVGAGLAGGAGAGVGALDLGAAAARAGDAGAEPMVSAAAGAGRRSRGVVRMLVFDGMVAAAGAG